MFINLPELDHLPADLRQSMLEEAARTVNAKHGTMSNVPHVVGCALMFVILIPAVVTHRSLLFAFVASFLLYFLSLGVGVLFWRRAMIRDLRLTVSRILATQGSGAVESLPCANSAREREC